MLIIINNLIMEYVKKKLNKLPSDDKLIAINEIISELEKIRNNININSNGNILLDFIDCNEEELKEELEDLNFRSKCDYDYTEEEIKLVKEDIKIINKKLECLKDILSITAVKEKEYEPNEGWNTTTRIIDIEIDLNANITVKIIFTDEYNGYDSSQHFYKKVAFYKNGNKLQNTKDYYVENDKYFNGKKINKSGISSSVNFQQSLDSYCKQNEINFEELPENEVLSIMNKIKVEIKKKKEEIELIEKNKNKNWTFLTNLILDKIENEDVFFHLFSNFD